MDVSLIFATLLDILVIPLQLILIPVDALLSQIPGLSVIPVSINAIVSLVGNIPSTLVHITGTSPILWNATIIVLILNLTAIPAINIGKRIWAWVRP